jgi:hypothetical protein
MLAIRVNSKLTAVAPQMARLLIRLEEDAYSDGRECPFCMAPDAPCEAQLPHSTDCELDRTLRAAGLRDAERCRVRRRITRAAGRSARASAR